MITVPATEFSKHFGRYREAVQRETVAVTSHERVTGYFVSTVDYEEYLRLKQFLPKSYAVSELPESMIDAIAATHMDTCHDSLNDLLDE